MRRLAGYIISMMLVLWPILCKAQDSVTVHQSKLAVQVFADVGKGVESVIGKQTKWELGASAILTGKYNVTLEYGYGQLNPESVINNGDYTSEGKYFRGGFEYMFTIKPKIYLSAGAMYASSNFKDSGHVQIISDIWDDVNVEFSREGQTASWLEIIINTEMPLFKVEKPVLSNFFWGVRYRLRILTADISQPDFDIYAIPGYGRTYSNVVPAINLFIKYRIDF